MKDSRNTAKLLDLPYAPEAEALLDELEKSGQFRIGVDAEIDDESPDAPRAEYFWGRGSGNIAIDDWWTTGSIELRVGPGITPADIALVRINDSLVMRTTDGLDRVTIENYLGLIPDAATLRIVFNDGIELAGAPLLARVAGWLTETPTEIPPAR
jgi:hypothetical protein